MCKSRNTCWNCFLTEEYVRDQHPDKIDKRSEKGCRQYIQGCIRETFIVQCALREFREKTGDAHENERCGLVQDICSNIRSLSFERKQNEAGQYSRNQSKQYSSAERNEKQRQQSKNNSVFSKWHGHICQGDCEDSKQSCLDPSLRTIRTHKDESLLFNNDPFHCLYGKRASALLLIIGCFHDDR